MQEITKKDIYDLYNLRKNECDNYKKDKLNKIKELEKQILLYKEQICEIDIRISACDGKMRKLNIDDSDSDDDFDINSDIDYSLEINLKKNDNKYQLFKYNKDFNIEKDFLTVKELPEFQSNYDNVFVEKIINSFDNNNVDNINIRENILLKSTSRLYFIICFNQENMFVSIESINKCLDSLMNDFTSFLKEKYFDDIMRNNIIRNNITLHKVNEYKYKILSSTNIAMNYESRNNLINEFISKNETYKNNDLHKISLFDEKNGRYIMNDINTSDKVYERNSNSNILNEIKDIGSLLHCFVSEDAFHRKMFNQDVSFISPTYYITINNNNISVGDNKGGSINITSNVKELTINNNNNEEKNGNEKIYKKFISFVKKQPFYIEKVKLNDKKYSKSDLYDLYKSFLNDINDKTSSKDKSVLIRMLKYEKFIETFRDKDEMLFIY
jgi:hypothetical protein